MILGLFDGRVDNVPIRALGALVTESSFGTGVGKILLGALLNAFGVIR